MVTSYILTNIRVIPLYFSDNRINQFRLSVKYFLPQLCQKPFQFRYHRIIFFKIKYAINFLKNLYEFTAVLFIAVRIKKGFSLIVLGFILGFYD